MDFRELYEFIELDSINSNRSISNNKEGILKLNVKTDLKNIEKDECSKIILVVEDNEINMQVVTAFLKHMGYNYFKAYDGVQALEILNEERVSLILMDVQMPGLDGYETTKIARKILEAKGYYIPIVATTANSSIGDRELCLKNGMDDYMCKPLEFKGFKDLLGKYL